MVDKKFRAALAAYCEDHGLEGDDAPLLFDNHSYDASIVGITKEGRLVYDEDLMISELMEDEGWSYEDAVEWIEYNTLRSLPFADGKAPIVLNCDRRTVIDSYGD